MENDVFVIYDIRTQSTMIVVKNLPVHPSPLPTAILEWYAKEYAFERRNLGGYWMQTIDGKECPIITGTFFGAENKPMVSPECGECDGTGISRKTGKPCSVCAPIPPEIKTGARKIITGK